MFCLRFSPNLFGHKFDVLSPMTVNKKAISAGCCPEDFGDLSTLKKMLITLCRN